MRDDTVETLSARILKQEHADLSAGSEAFCRRKTQHKRQEGVDQKLTATLMDGKALAAQVKLTLKEEAEVHEEGRRRAQAGDYPRR